MGTHAMTSKDARPDAERDPFIAATGSAGTIAPPLFFVVMIVLGEITPGYDPLSRFGSELSLGRYGWVMVTNFLLLGISMVALAAGLWREAHRRRRGSTGAFLVGLAGLAFLDAGVFVTDLQGAPVTLHGGLHVLAALVLFLIAIPGACIAFARGHRQHRRFAIWSWVTAAASPSLFVVTFLSGPLLGLSERVLIGVDLAWLTIVAMLLTRGFLSRA